MRDDDFADQFIARNRAVLNEVLKEARASIRRGEGVEVASYEEFIAAIAKHRDRWVKRKE